MIFKCQKEKQGEKLIEEAEELGVSKDDIFRERFMSSYYLDNSLKEAELQERIRSAKNIRYARLTWIIALISAIASLISAIAAWLAVLK